VFPSSTKFVSVQPALALGIATSFTASRYGLSASDGASKLIPDWSPEQISGWLELQYPNEESMRGGRNRTQLFMVRLLISSGKLSSVGGAIIQKSTWSSPGNANPPSLIRRGWWTSWKV
jgi:hypothetical protein